MTASTMQLKIVLPTKVFLEVGQVSNIYVETPAGAFGFLPARLDCVSAVVPGILSYQMQGDREAFVALDEGVLVKHGQQVLIAVRRAFAGNDLELLHQQLHEKFLQQGAEEEDHQRLQKKLESGFLRRFADFRNER